MEANEEEQVTDTPTSDPSEHKTPIQPRHIAICGGIIYGFAFHGIFHRLAQQEYLDMNQIKTIHGTSAGSVMAVVLALKEDWDVLEKYILDRPWTEVFQISISTVLGTLKNCGIFNRNYLIRLCRPLFAAHDLNIETITMQEFYEYSQIEVHIYATDATLFQLEDISWKTYPNWRVVDAMFASCGFPVLFQPYQDPFTGHIFMDGGVFMNYPLLPCIQTCIQYDEPLDSILGIQLDLQNVDDIVHEINYPKSLIDYIYMLTNKVVWKFTDMKKDEAHDLIRSQGSSCPREILVKTPRSAFDIMPFAKYRELRLEFVQMGKDQADEFLTTIGWLPKIST